MEVRDCSASPQAQVSRYLAQYPLSRFSLRLLAVLLLTSLLSAGGLMTLESASASSMRSLDASTTLAQARPDKSTRVPPAVVNRVRRDLSRRVNIPPGKLRLVESQSRPEEWSDACLGLAQPDEVCAQIIVPGWRIVLTDGQRSWVYRTDTKGESIRLETPNTSQVALPQAIATAVLRQASQQTGVTVGNLQIVQAERQTWPDGCLGLAEPDQMCTQALVPGWRVVVATGQQRLVYRTNATGSLVKLDKAASNNPTTSLQPRAIPSAELPPALQAGELFRAISSGGITGQTYQTTLMRNGQLQRSRLGADGKVLQTEARQLSSQQVQTFQRLLSQSNLEPFHRLSYSAPQGAADFITVTVTGPQGSVRYADIVSAQLPAPLQRVIQAWNQLSS